MEQHLNKSLKMLNLCHGHQQAQAQNNFSHVIEVRFKSGHSSVSTDETVSSSNVTPIEISVLDSIFVSPNSHQSLITVFLRTLDIMMAFQNTLTTKVDKKERVESGRCNLWWVAIHHPAKSDKWDFPMHNLRRHSISREGCGQTSDWSVWDIRDTDRCGAHWN